MKVRNIIIVLFIVISGCKNDEKISYDVPELPLGGDSEYLMVENLIQESKFVKLKTPENVVIGEIYQVIFSKNRIFINDFKHTKSVFIFDHQGNYLNHIIGNSKGPEEFIRPTYISADYNNNTLYVLDDKSSKLIAYNSNGDFIDYFTVNFNCYGLSKLNNNLFAFQSGLPSLDNKAKHQILYTNKNGKIINRFFKPEKWRKESIYSKRFNFSENLEEAYYSPVYSGYIYSMKENLIKPEFHINIGENNITREEAQKTNAKDKYPHTIESFLKAGDNFYYNYVIVNRENRNVINHVFYNISSKKLVSGYYLVNSNSNCQFFDTPIAAFGDYFVSSIDAYQFIEKYKSLKKHGCGLTNEVEEIASHLTDDDNPLLYLYKLDL